MLFFRHWHIFTKREKSKQNQTQEKSNLNLLKITKAEAEGWGHLSRLYERLFCRVDPQVSEAEIKQ